MEYELFKVLISIFSHKNIKTVTDFSGYKIAFCKNALTLLNRLM